MKKIIEKWKIRGIVAIVVTILLLGLSAGAVFGNGIHGGKLFIAVVLSILAGGCIWWDVKIPRVASILVVLLIPAGTLCCMEFFTHVPWDLTPLIFLLNYWFYLIAYLIFTFLLGDTRWAYVAGTALPMLFGMLNYFVVSFRSSPVVPWDIFSFGTAASVADSYTFSLDYRLVFVVFGFVFLMILGEKTTLVLKNWKLRIASALLSAVLMCGYVGAIQTDTVERSFGLDNILFTPNVLYRNNGLIGAFLANLRYLKVEKPAGYSVRAAEAMRDEYRQNGEKKVESTLVKPADKPNILVIMNEAFSDLSIYGAYESSSDSMPFIRSLKENTVKGNLFVSVKGGNTANTEFEFLTGNSMAFMPNGSIPYQQFIKHKMPSLASHLSGLGYHTAALHPYYATGWNRDEVYQHFGFDDLYFRGDFEHATTLRGFVDDKSAFQKLIELYEQKPAGEKLFAFEVTMQNHGGYSKEYADLEPEVLLTGIPEEEKNTNIRATEKYLTLIQKTDQEFQKFLDYFAAQEEKTIIVMFGDHQPSDYVVNPILDELGIDRAGREAAQGEQLVPELFAAGYQVPFVIWANYDIEEAEVNQISVNYLSSAVMDIAGLPKTEYQNYLSLLREEFPVITANFYIDTKTGQPHKLSEAQKAETGDMMLNEYAILQYNDLLDHKRRLDGFF